MGQLSHGESAGIGTGIGTVLAPGFGTVLGGAIGSLFGGGKRPVTGRTFDELNPGGGGASGIPGDIGNTSFNPVSVWGNLPDIDRGPFPNGPIYNPYGIARPQQSYGRSSVYGGPNDLAKSVATRSIGINLAQDQLASTNEGTPPGLSSALQSFASGGDGLTGEAYSNIMPGIDSTSYLNNYNYRNNLTDIMQNAYMLGGQLYGGQAAGWAAAKAQDKQRRAQHTAATQAWVGAFLPQEAGLRDIGQGATGLAG